METPNAEQMNQAGFDDVLFLDITFAGEPATVCLPKIPPQVIDRAVVQKCFSNRAAFRGPAAHMKPLIEVARDYACSVLLVMQGGHEFTAPKGTWITLIGDDAALSLGPQAFHRASVEAVVKAADRAIVVASGPEMYCYNAAATLAARDRKNVILIETLPHRLSAWEDVLKELRGDELATITCLPAPWHDDADAECREPPEYCEAE